MLNEIMQHKGGTLSSEEALDILRSDARPKRFRDWPVFLVMAVYGVSSFLIGNEYAMVFFFAMTCLAMAMHRNDKRQSEVARAVLALLDKASETEDSRDS